MKGSSSYRDYALWRGDYLGGRCVLRDIEAVIAKLMMSTAEVLQRVTLGRKRSLGHSRVVSFDHATSRKTNLQLTGSLRPVHADRLDFGQFPK